jgi:hypothetical protein
MNLSIMPEKKPSHEHFTLHTAVDHVGGQGAGIGVIMASRVTLQDGRTVDLPGVDRSYGITREQLAVQEIKTATRAHVHAMSHALGLATNMIKLIDPINNPMMAFKVTVLVDSTRMVENINLHVSRGCDNLAGVRRDRDRTMIKQVVDAVGYLTGRSVEVELAAYAGRGEQDERERARAMSSRKRIDACKSRRERKKAARQHHAPGQEAINFVSNTYSQGTSPNVLPYRCSR